MTSKHFDDIIAISQVWRQLPSELTLRYMPELRTRHHVTAADLFMLDVAATVRWSELQRERVPRTAEAAHPARARSEPAIPTRAAAQERGDHLAIQGTEIPPWDPRYKGKSKRR